MNKEERALYSKAVTIILGALNRAVPCAIKSISLWRPNSNDHQKKLLRNHGNAAKLGKCHLFPKNLVPIRAAEFDSHSIGLLEDEQQIKIFI